MLEKTTVAEQDLAIGIQYTATLAMHRQLTFTTGCAQDISGPELDLLLRKFAKAADAADALYRKRALMMEIENAEKALIDARNRTASYEEQAAVQFAARGRGGPLKLTDSQQAELKNFHTSEIGAEHKVKEFRKQLAEVEKLLEVT